MVQIQIVEFHDEIEEHILLWKINRKRNINYLTLLFISILLFTSE